MVGILQDDSFVPAAFEAAHQGDFMNESYVPNPLLINQGEIYNSLLFSRMYHIPLDKLRVYGHSGSFSSALRLWDGELRVREGEIAVITPPILSVHYQLDIGPSELPVQLRERYAYRVNPRITIKIPDRELIVVEEGELLKTYLVWLGEAAGFALHDITRPEARLFQQAYVLGKC